MSPPSTVILFCDVSIEQQFYNNYTEKEKKIKNLNKYIQIKIKYTLTQKYIYIPTFYSDKSDVWRALAVQTNCCYLGFEVDF